MITFILGLFLGIVFGIGLIFLFNHFFHEGVLEVDNTNRKWRLIITIPEGDIVKYSNIRLKVVNKCKDAE